jgi:hypothetical protein
MVEAGGHAMVHRFSVSLFADETDEEGEGDLEIMTITNTIRQHHNANVTSGIVRPSVRPSDWPTD